MYTIDIFWIGSSTPVTQVELRGQCEAYGDVEEKEFEIVKVYIIL